MKPWILILVLLCGLFCCDIADACPTCKLAVEGGPDHSQLGYAYSILFMMSMPFLIAIGWAFFIVRSTYRVKKESAESTLASVSG